MRFNDQPLLNPLVGNERIPGTSTDSGDDFSTTPLVITQFAQSNMSLASGTSNGLMSGAQATKLNALRTNAENDLLNAQLGQTSIPLFFASAADGTIEVYENLTENDQVLDRIGFGLSSGSTTLTVLIDGVPVTGLASIPVTVAGGHADASAANTVAPESIVSLQLSDSDTPLNLRLTMKADVTLE